MAARCGVESETDINERRANFEYEDLIPWAGRIVWARHPQLPLPPLLMFDRITNVSEQGGANGKGVILAQLSVQPDLWFFGCHFKGDPVMPGCLGLDALWQLLGFYLGWLGLTGRGRALGVGEVKFSDQILPTVKRIIYGVGFETRVQNQTGARHRRRLARSRWNTHI